MAGLPLYPGIWEAKNHWDPRIVGFQDILMATLFVVSERNLHFGTSKRSI